MKSIKRMIGAHEYTMPIGYGMNKEKDWAFVDQTGKEIHYKDILMAIISGEGSYGVFLYKIDDDPAGEDLNIHEMNAYFNDKGFAIEYAMNLMTTRGHKYYYVEVWPSNDDGYWGAQGRPEFASLGSGFYEEVQGKGLHD